MHFPLLEQKIAERLDALKQGIDLRRNGKQLILSGSGKRLMDDLRHLIDAMEAEENNLLAQRIQASQTSGRDLVLTFLIANAIAGSLLIWAAYILLADSTARRRAEQALQEQRQWLEVTLASIGDAVITADTGGSVTTMNPVAQVLTGWTQDQAKGQPLLRVFNIVNEDSRKPVENPAVRAMREGAIVGLANHTILIAKNGSELPIDDSGSPIKTPAEKVIGAVLIFRDITERKRLENERSHLLAAEQLARRQAEAASRAKDEFIAVVSHELRNPLNAILGWAQVLGTGRLDAQQSRQGIEAIERNARLQSQLIEDLLDVSRIITGKLNLEVKPVDLATVIEGALDTVRPGAAAKAIQLDVRIEAKGSLVSGDANRLQQVVWNLLSNAVKFTPKNGAVAVRLNRIDSHLELLVQDSGPGIHPDFLPHIFDRFSQAANMTSEQKLGGLGLGLAIVRNLVELHGGTVQAENLGNGQGALFRVTFPVRAVRGPGETTADLSVNVGSLAETIRLDGLRVLIVDDDPETREMLTAMLTQRGATVQASASAREALDTAKSWQPAILVSDIGMPDEDGYTLIRRIRASIPRSRQHSRRRAHRPLPGRTIATAHSPRASSCTWPSR